MKNYPMKRINYDNFILLENELSNSCKHHPNNVKYSILLKHLMYNMQSYDLLLQKLNHIIHSVKWSIFLRNA